MSKNYTKKTLSVNELQVDLKNPRLPHSREFLDYNSVLEYLQEKEDVLEIAESIAENGVFPSEPLIAVEENGIHNVIEGNRRLVAMKLLANPNLAIKFKQKFNSLSSQADQSELDQLEVIVYNDRLSAAPLLIKRHTNDPAKIRQWEMIMKAYYTAGFMKAGSSITDVAKALSIEVSSLRDDLKLLQLYLLAKVLPFEKGIKEKINDEKTFSLSNLQRAINSKAGGTLLNLKFDDNIGQLVLSYDKKEFLKPYAKLIQDIADESFNSRTQNKAEDIEEYFNGFVGKLSPEKNISGNDNIEEVIKYAEGLISIDEIYPAPESQNAASGSQSTSNTSPSGTGTNSQAQTNNNNASSPAGSSAASSSSSSAGTQPATSDNSPNSPQTPKPPTPRKRTSIIYQDIKVNKNSTNQRITKIVTELKKIDAVKFNNATGVLLRTLLDLVTHEFIKAQGEDKNMLAEAQSNLKNGKTLREFWTPDLKPMLTRIINKKFGLPATTLSALKKHIGTHGDANVLYILNEIVHNPDFNFGKQDLLDVYDKLEPYLKEVL